MEYTVKGLDKVKVGDLVAPIRVRYGSTDTQTWTGVLRQVVKVGAKRFSLGGNDWIDKGTGFAVGSHGGRYVLATKEMIAEVERKDRERKEREREARAFYVRPEYRYASAIAGILETLSPETLDRMTVEDWAAFHAKLTP